MVWTTQVYEVENGFQVRVNGRYLGQYIGLEYAEAAAAKAEVALQGEYGFRSRKRPMRRLAPSPATCP